MTMFSVSETVERLRGSLATIEWAVERVPDKWTHALPDFYPGDAWSVAMNLAHMTIYEEEISGPVLRALAAGGDGLGAARSRREDWFLNDAVALSHAPVSEIMRRLVAGRADQIASVAGYDEDRFNAPVTPLWASGRHGAPPHSAGWVATKTFQHTWEHGNAILRMALFAPQ
jgi:hypothetical protein